MTNETSRNLDSIFPEGLNIDRRRPTVDERAGIEWWNSLDDKARRYWSEQAGNTGRAADAWADYKRQQKAPMGRGGGD